MHFGPWCCGIIVRLLASISGGSRNVCLDFVFLLIPSNLNLSSDFTAKFCRMFTCTMVGFYMCVLLHDRWKWKFLAFHLFSSLHNGRVYVSIYRLILDLNYMGCDSSLITGWDAGGMPRFGCRELLQIPENHLSTPCKKALLKSSLDVILYNHATWCNGLEPVLIVLYLQMDESILEQWDELYSNAYSRQMERDTVPFHESHSLQC